MTIPQTAKAAPRRSAPAGVLPVGGFTLMELLMVVAIIGAIVAVGLPAARNYNRGNLTASATRQLMDDLAQARYRAISSRSEVYVVFVSPAVTALDPSLLTSADDRALLTNLYLGQFTGYALYSPRTVGDQPGRGTARYLTPWRMLPKGAFVPAMKYFAGSETVINNLASPTPVRAFTQLDRFKVPFPTAGSGVYMKLPFVGFDYQGRLITGREEIIPIGEGAVDVARAPNGQYLLQPAVIVERPAGRWTNQPTVVRVDWLTGRGRVEKVEIR